ncbi:MAG: stage II sporulation protein M [Cytophagales bacterium]|nr:MAG: stage II sporulation protein M [Cytophagales bacterium]
MKESEFIQQNKVKWKEFENNLLEKSNPSKISKLFIQITEDLSYANTFYKNRSVRLYLGGIVGILHNSLNFNTKNTISTFLEFWKKELPLAMFQARRPMLISMIVFSLCFILGVVSSIQDENFAAMILSKDYVNMTEKNIENGDPMAVYKTESELNTFVPIFLNNLKVDFITFFSGIFISLGTLVVIISNGVMVGVFQYFFIQRDVFWESFLGIWTHGALEISAIIISGGAGLTLGKGFLFPGEYSRFSAFKMSAMNGLVIIVGVIPITLVAAFIEGFLTRQTEIPDIIRLLFIIISFAFVFFYFFFYPRKMAKKYPLEADRLYLSMVSNSAAEVDLTQIFSSGKIISESFRFVFNHFLFFGKYLFIIALFFALAYVYNPMKLFRLEDDNTYSLANIFFGISDYPLMGVLCLSVISILGVNVISYLIGSIKDKLITEDKKAVFEYFDFMLALLPLVIASSIFFFLFNQSLIWVFFFIFPFFTLVSIVSIAANINIYQSIAYTFRLINSNLNKFITTHLFFLLVISILYFTFLYGLELLFIDKALVWMVTDEGITAERISLGIMVFQTFISILAYMSITFVANFFLYFSLKETYTAENLIANIQKITFRK